jgi:hypothetical protein
MEVPTKQPPNWMGFDRFSEADNAYIHAALHNHHRMYDPLSFEYRLLETMRKMAELLNEKEAQDASS